MTLASRVLHPARTRPADERVVLLHGFTQNAECWEPFAGMLADQTGMEILAIDAPGHGLSPRRHDAADLWESATLLADVGGTAHYVGYSMGGRTALHLAVLQPDAILSLNLIGATPGIADPAERAARLAADHALADKLQTIGVPAFLDRWLAQPMFRGLDAESAHLAARLHNRADGMAASLRHCGTGAQEDLQPRLAALSQPTLVIVGAEDEKFASIGLELPGSLHRVSGAGHTAHLERPGPTADAVGRFIRSVRRPDTR